MRARSTGASASFPVGRSRSLHLVIVGEPLPFGDVRHRPSTSDSSRPSGPATSTRSAAGARRGRRPRRPRRRRDAGRDGRHDRPPDRTLLRALLEAGADVDAQDATLDNPFLYAGREGLLDILRLANEAEADPTITNRYGGVALIPASERGHVEVVRYLLNETDIDVDHVNQLGWTALLEAILLSDGGPPHQEIVGLLHRAGADVDLADGDGVRPLAHARARGQIGDRRGCWRRPTPVPSR